MTNTSTHTKPLIPKLRFKEFEGIGEGIVYERHSFQDIFIFSTGKNIKQKEASPEFETPCVRYGELYHMYNEVIHQVINRTNLDKSELLFSEGNEILLPSAGEDPLDIGSASALTVPNVAIGRTINILKPKEDKLYSQIYVSYYINEKLRKKISTLAKGSSISNVYNSDLKKLKINLPNLLEQQKIANFLTAVDTKLQLLTTKKETLAQYKKGVMQQLFSQQLRFKDDDGSDFADWENVRFTDCCNLIHGFQFRQEHFTEKGIPIIKIGSLVDNGGLTFENATYVDKNSRDSFLKYLLHKGDVLMALTGGTLGKVSKIDKDYGLIFQNYRVGKFEPRNNALKEYIYFILQSSLVQNRVQSLVNEAAQPNFGKQDFDKIKFSLPSLKEQQKIANYLSAIDKKIEAVQTQLTQTQAFKKGLLQQMFV